MVWAIGNHKLYKLKEGTTNWVPVVNGLDGCNGQLMIFAKSGSVFLAGGSAGLCYSRDDGERGTNPQASMAERHMVLRLIPCGVVTMTTKGSATSPLTPTTTG